MDKKETKKKLNAEELEKRSAPFVSGPMDDTSGGGSGTPTQSGRIIGSSGGDVDPTLDSGGDGTPGTDPRIDRQQGGHDGAQRGPGRTNR